MTRCQVLHCNASTHSNTFGTISFCARELQDAASQDLTPIAIVEFPLGKDRTLFGTSEKDSFEKSLKLETAYKKGKTITITLKGSNNAIETHEPFIAEWLAQFVVMP